MQILAVSVKCSDSAFYSKLYSGGFSVSSALAHSLTCHTRKIGFDQSGSSRDGDPESLRVGQNSGSLTESTGDNKLSQSRIKSQYCLPKFTILSRPQVVLLAIHHRPSALVPNNTHPFETALGRSHRLNTATAPFPNPRYHSESTFFQENRFIGASQNTLIGPRPSS